ncbi:MAG TPA: hypothetical protein VFX06_16630 [Stellaceae bacterium]|jgi:hypothetical protein|nr:hypothetical protein [Stellaceae bacterium]
MRTALSAFAVLMLALGLPAAGSAQEINASLAPALGGTGIGPNGAGFDGALGDPVFLAENPGVYAPAVRGAPGAITAPALPGTYGVTPRGPVIEYYYAPPSIR